MITPEQQMMQGATDFMNSGAFSSKSGDAFSGLGDFSGRTGGMLNFGGGGDLIMKGSKLSPLQIALVGGVALAGIWLFKKR